MHICCLPTLYYLTHGKDIVCEAWPNFKSSGGGNLYPVSQTFGTTNYIPYAQLDWSIVGNVSYSFGTPGVSTFRSGTSTLDAYTTATIDNKVKVTINGDIVVSITQANDGSYDAAYSEYYYNWGASYTDSHSTSFADPYPSAARDPRNGWTDFHYYTAPLGTTLTDSNTTTNNHRTENSYYSGGSDFSSSELEQDATWSIPITVTDILAAFTTNFASLDAIPNVSYDDIGQTAIVRDFNFCTTSWNTTTCASGYARSLAVYHSDLMIGITGYAKHVAIHYKVIKCGDGESVDDGEEVDEQTLTLDVHFWTDDDNALADDMHHTARLELLSVVKDNLEFDSGNEYNYWVRIIGLKFYPYELP